MNAHQASSGSMLEQSGFAADVCRQDWPAATLAARQHPDAALQCLHDRKVLSPDSPWHRLETLLIHAEMALLRGRRVEAGWALYFARQLGNGRLKAPPYLLQAAHLTHPIWHQPIRGARIQLIRPSPRHLPFLNDTLSNRAFVDHYNPHLGPAKLAAEGYVQRGTQPPEQLRQLDWVVEQAGKPLGLMSLADLTWPHQRAELLVGFPENCTGRISVEASLLAMAAAFECLDIERLVSYVFADNVHAQRGTLALGFVHEGTLRQHLTRPGQAQRIDLLANGMLATEFSNSDRLRRLWLRLLGSRKPGHLFEGTQLCV